MVGGILAFVVMHFGLLWNYSMAITPLGLEVSPAEQLQELNDIPVPATCNGEYAGP